MNASQLRSKAWESLKGNYWPAVLAALVAAIFGALVTNAGVSGNFNINEETMRSLFENVPILSLLLTTAVAGFFGTLSLVNLILGGVVQLGYAGFLLKQQDREIGSVKDLFSRFDYFADGFLQLLLRSVFIALWSLLLVVPGIVKSLAYAMTPFIMAENPGMKAKEAIKLSQEKMMGHKWELFCLNFSFIGWYLLAALTGGIGTIFLNPYVNAAYAVFYREKIAPKTQVVTYEYTAPQINNT